MQNKKQQKMVDNVKAMTLVVHWTSEKFPLAATFLQCLYNSYRSTNYLTKYTINANETWEQEDDEKDEEETEKEDEDAKNHNVPLFHAHSFIYSAWAKWMSSVRLRFSKSGWRLKLSSGGSSDDPDDLSAGLALFRIAFSSSVRRNSSCSS